MAVSNFDQIRSGVYRPPSAQEATSLLEQGEAIHERVEAAVFKRNLFYVLAAVVFIVGGALTGGALYLTFPWYAALVTGIVAAVGTGAAVYKASTIKTSQKIDDCALKAFRFEKCRVSGKRNLRSEEVVEAALRQDLRNPDFKIRAQLLNQTLSFTSENGFIALKDTIYSHFLTCSKGHKQAMRRTYKLLDRLHEGAREKIERKLSGELKEFALANGIIEHDDQTEFSESQTEVELFLLEDQERVRTFSVYKLTKAEENPRFDSSVYLPVLIEEDYRSRKQKVICQLEEVCIMPATKVPNVDQVLIQNQEIFASERPDQAALEAAVSPEAPQFQQVIVDLGRAYFSVNEREYQYGAHLRGGQREYLDAVIEDLVEKGYSSKELILCLACIQQNVMKISRDFFIESGPFCLVDPRTGELRYALSRDEAGVQEAADLLRKNLDTSRIYHAIFEGPQSEKNFVDYSHSFYLQDRVRREIIHLEIQGKYHLTQGIEKARARVIDRVPYALPE